MKAVVLEEYGGPEVLRLREVTMPSPAEDEVLIRVLYTAINALEWKLRQGMGEKMGFDLTLPFVLGCEIAGTVEAVGSQAHDFKVGDDVFGFVDVKRSGGYAEYITAKASEIGHKPRNIDFAHAAAIPVGALTVWQALFETASLQSGQTILIHGATGGVGSLAVQLARSRGAYVIATGSKHSEEFVRSLGADAFIDYTTRRFEDVVHGVDVVFDPVGGQMQERSFSSLKIGGFLVSIVAPPSAELAAKHNIRSAVVYARPDNRTLAEISRLVEDERLYSSIDTLLPLCEVQQAHRLMETGHKRGKIVLQIGEKGVSDG